MHFKVGSFFPPTLILWTPGQLMFPCFCRQSIFHVWHLRWKMSVRWRFKWGLLFWHAVSITSFSIPVSASTLPKNVLNIWHHTVWQRICFTGLLMNLTMHWNKLAFLCCIFFSPGFWNSEEGFWYSELWLCLVFPHLLWLWWTALHLISWSAATNMRVISQPHPAKHCTAFHFIFLQQQWCISLLHMFSLTALICRSLLPVGMCMYMHCISCSRACQCLAHGHKLEFDVPPVKCFVLLLLSGSVCAHLMCKSGPMLACSNNDAASLSPHCSGKKSTWAQEVKSFMINHAAM